MNLLVPGQQIAAQLVKHFKDTANVDVDLVVTFNQLERLQAATEAFSGVLVVFDGMTPQTVNNRTSIQQRWQSWLITWGETMTPTGKTFPEGELAGEVFKALNGFQLTHPPADPDGTQLRLAQVEMTSSPSMIEVPGGAYFPLRWTTTVTIC